MFFQIRQLDFRVQFSFKKQLSFLRHERTSSHEDVDFFNVKIQVNKCVPQHFLLTGSAILSIPAVNTAYTSSSLNSPQVLLKHNYAKDIGILYHSRSFAQLWESSPVLCLTSILGISVLREGLGLSVLRQS